MLCLASNGQPVWHRALPRQSRTARRMGPALIPMTRPARSIRLLLPPHTSLGVDPTDSSSSIWSQ